MTIPANIVTRYRQAARMSPEDTQRYLEKLDLERAKKDKNLPGQKGDLSKGFLDGLSGKKFKEDQTEEWKLGYEAGKQSYEKRWEDYRK